MSTNSAIAEPHAGDTWRGRYVHWDGFPTWNGRVLHELVNEHGVEKVRQVILHDNAYGWSNVDNRSLEQRASSVEIDLRSPDRFKVIEGWGTAWTAEQGIEEWVTPANVEKIGFIEIVFVLGDSSLLMLRAGTDRFVEVPYAKEHSMEEWTHDEDFLYGRVPV